MRGIFRSQSERIVFDCEDDKQRRIRIGNSLARDEAEENVAFVRMSSKKAEDEEKEEVENDFKKVKKKVSFVFRD